MPAGLLVSEYTCSSNRRSTRQRTRTVGATGVPSRVWRVRTGSRVELLLALQECPGNCVLLHARLPQGLQTATVAIKSCVLLVCRQPCVANPPQWNDATVPPPDARRDRSRAGKWCLYAITVHHCIGWRGTAQARAQILLAQHGVSRAMRKEVGAAQGATSESHVDSCSRCGQQHGYSERLATPSTSHAFGSRCVKRWASYTSTTVVLKYRSECLVAVGAARTRFHEKMPPRVLVAWLRVQEP